MRDEILQKLWKRIKYCPNCGASVSEEQSGKNENSYQESNADGSLWESLVEFFKALIEYMKEAGLHIIDAIDKIIQMPPNIPKDSICPYCNKRIQYGARVLWNVFARSVWIIVRSAFHGL